MADEGSITRLIGRLKDSDPDAAQRLWEAYFGRLVALARARLRGTSRASADEEDVALSALDSFCRRAGRGQFPRLQDREDLWQLLFVIAVRKAINLAHRQGRQARGAVSLADLQELDQEPALSTEPTPELAAQMADDCRRLLGRLGDASLRSVALWKMEGYTNAEIAARLGCAERSVERKLRAIRRRWAEEVGP